MTNSCTLLNGSLSYSFYPLPVAYVWLSFDTGRGGLSETGWIASPPTYPEHSIFNLINVIFPKPFNKKKKKQIFYIIFAKKKTKNVVSSHNMPASGARNLRQKLPLIWKKNTCNLHYLGKLIFLFVSLCRRKGVFIWFTTYIRISYWNGNLCFQNDG